MMKTTGQAIGVIAAVLLLIGSAVSCEAFYWRECRQVGHSQLYCAMQIGRK